VYAQINPNHFLVDLDRTCEEAYPDWYEDVRERAEALSPKLETPGVSNVRSPTKLENLTEKFSPKLETPGVSNVRDPSSLSLFKKDCKITGAATFERWHRIEYDIMFDVKIKEFVLGLVQRGMLIFVTAGDLVHGTEIVKKMIQHTNLEAYQHKIFILAGRVLGQGAWKSQNLIFPLHIIEKLRILAIDDCDVWHDTELIKVDPWCPPGFKGYRIHDRKFVYNEYDEERLIKVLKRIDEKNPPILPLEDPTFYLSESRIKPYIVEIMDQFPPYKKRKSVTFNLDLTIHTVSEPPLLETPSVSNVPNHTELQIVLEESSTPIQRNKSFDDLRKLDV
jgi:hypothetical protein